MTNDDIIIQSGANPEPFFQEFSEYLSNNLDDDLCRSLANLLAIDYANRLNSKPNLKDYIHTCIKRIKKYLGARVILDNNFSEAMTLFTISITNEQEVNDTSSRSEEKHQDILIENIIATLFGELTAAEQENIKIIIKNLLNGKNAKEIINIISITPQTLKNLIARGLEAKMPIDNLSKFIETNLEALLIQHKEIHQRVNTISNIIGKITMIGGIFLSSSIGLVMQGLAFPALIIPTMISAVKVAPIMGEKLSDTLIKNNDNIQNKIQKLDIDKKANIKMEQNINRNIEGLSTQKQRKKITKNLIEKIGTIPKIPSASQPIQKTKETKKKSTGGRSR